MASKEVKDAVQLFLDKYPDAKDVPPGLWLPVFYYIRFLERTEKVKYESRSI